MQSSNTCAIQGHDNKQIISICLKKDCQLKNKFMCSQCRITDHSDHIQQSILLQDLFCANKDRYSIPYWPRDNEEVANQISEFFTKRQLQNQDKEIDKIFEQIKEKIIIIIDEAKQKAKEAFGNDSQVLTDLHQQFTELFPIQKLQSIVGAALQQQETKNYEQFSKKLSDLLDIEQRQNKIIELKDLFDDINQMKKSINPQNLVNQLVNELPNIFIQEQLEKQIENQQHDLDELFNKDLESLQLQKQVSQQSEVYKIVILGDPSVGKTSIINQLIGQSFSDSLPTTKQISFQSINFVDTPQKSTVYKIYDVFGQYNDVFHKNIDLNYLFESANCIIIVYDISNQKSFENVEQWRAHFFEFGINYTNQLVDKFPIFVVGNKIDKEDRQVKQEDAQQWCKVHGTQYSEISAKNFDKTHALFLEIYNYISKN